MDHAAENVTSDLLDCSVLQRPKNSAQEAPVITTPSLPAPASDSSIDEDVGTIGRISSVPALLRVICDTTGMGFATVARVTDDSWTACAVQDRVAFGLVPGSRLEISTTLCSESRRARQPVVIDHVSEDPVYRDHHTPRLYGFESYVSVPIIRRDGSYFGNLCAIDPKPAKASEPRTMAMLQLFAELIALQLDNEDRYTESESALRSEQETSELREQFIAVLGHDLRNPLAAIDASAQLLAARPAEPQGVKVGRRLLAATRRMALLIDDVMDFARGRLGSGLDVTIASVDDLGTALHDVVEELRLGHPGRQVLDTIQIGQPVACDRARLQQLLSNLLGNALTYGAPDRPVVVEVRVAEDSLTLAVANHGEPIAPMSVDKVFEPYWRPAHSKPGGGLGLGLYICAQIVKAHAGTLSVRSSREDGTRFIATLPLRPTA